MCYNLSMEKFELITLVESGLSQYEIAFVLGKSQTTVRYWLNKYNLHTHKRRMATYSYCLFCNKPISSKNKYCNNTCHANHKAMIFGEKWIKNGQTVLPPFSQRTGLLHGTARRFIFLKKSNKCEICSWTHYLDDETLPPLECSHIDNDHSNNNYDNFELLCPNCHAIKTRLNPIKKGNGRWSNGADSRNKMGQ